MRQPSVDHGLLIIEFSRSHSDTTHLVESPGRVIGPSQRPLPDNTQHSQETDIHDPGGIRTRNPSMRETVDPRLRPLGHWDRLHRLLQQEFKSTHTKKALNPLNAELNPIRHLLALVGARHIVHVSRIRVKRRIKPHPPFASTGRGSPYCPR